LTYADQETPMHRDDLTETLRLGTVSMKAALSEAEEARSRSDMYEVLSHVTNALHDAIEAEARTVAVWRSWGATWTEVGEFYGITKQAAQQRFGSLDHPVRAKLDERNERVSRRNTAQEHATIELDEPESPRAESTSVDAPRGTISSYQTTVAEQIAASSKYFGGGS
jgi:hypothetical protein